MEWPQAYRLSDIPRSITWSEVRDVLAGVDRRTPAGKRDYAILLLLVSYGLRGREVAALTLDDIDWKRERLAVPERKAGHSTAFPLSATVGEAIIDYVRHGRPQTKAGGCSSGRSRRSSRSDPRLFPLVPVTISSRPAFRLSAGVAHAPAHVT